MVLIEFNFESTLQTEQWFKLSRLFPVDPSPTSPRHPVRFPLVLNVYFELLGSVAANERKNDKFRHRVNYILLWKSEFIVC